MLGLREEKTFRGVARGKPEKSLKWAERLRRQARYFAATGELEPSSQGNSTVHRSQLDELKVELRAQLVKERVGGVSLFRYRALNTGLLILVCYRSPLASSSTLSPPATQKIVQRTASRWLAKLGLTYRPVRKGVYIDGHERPDVVERKIEYLRALRDDFIPLAVTVLPFVNSFARALCACLLCSVSLSTKTMKEYQPNRLCPPAPSGTT